MNSITALVLKYRNLGWPLVSIIISILLLIFIIIPQILGIVGLRRNIADLKVRIDNLNTKASTLSGIDTKKYQQNLSIALTVLPEQKDIPSTIGQIQNLLNANKMALNNIIFANSNGAGGGVQNSQIRLEASGDPLAIKNFINGLKDSAQIIKLSGIELSGNQFGQYSSVINLNTYYQNAPGNLGDIEQPVSLMTNSESDLLNKLQKRVQNQPTISSTTSVENLGPRGKTDPFQ